MRVVAILASHNRRALTERCLESYFAQTTPSDWSLSAVVADDASVDGTAAALTERFPDVRILAGDGSLYWAGGMALAERGAMERPFDLLVWLNDDVTLDADALTRLAGVADAHSIAVGAMRDPVSGETTYSGYRIPGRHPLRVELIEPADRPLPVETFNGNAVAEVSDLIETLDRATERWEITFRREGRVRTIVIS